MSLTLVDFFCGAGGSSQGFSAIPDIEVLAAANHWDSTVEAYNRRRSRFVVSGISMSCRIRRLPSNGTTRARKIKMRPKSQCIASDQITFVPRRQDELLERS